MSIIDITEPATIEFTRPTWIVNAACRGMKTDLFFPARGEDTSQAKAVCAGCPVRAECLEAAMVNGDKFGIFGGKSDHERRALRRGRQLHEFGSDDAGTVLRLVRDAHWRMDARGYAPAHPPVDHEVSA